MCQKCVKGQREEVDVERLLLRLIKESVALNLRCCQGGVLIS